MKLNEFKKVNYMKRLLLISFLFIGCQNVSTEIIVDSDVNLGTAKNS